MDDAFATATAQFEQSLSAAASPEQTTEAKAPDIEATSDQTISKDPTSSVSQAIAELDKMDKFKLDGQEWTLKDLKAAIMRQKDYTAKTQSVAEERKSLEGERKFYENLAFDLRSLEKNPGLVHEFLKVYPQKFHQYAEQVLKNTPEQPVSQQTPPVQQQPQQDVQLLSRLSTLEKFYHDQEVAKNEASIKNTMDELTKKYPETDKRLAKETILARAHELYIGNKTPLTNEMWETIFKDVAEEVKELSKAEYGQLVKKQTEANSKAKDVGTGGGAAGRAPLKFKNFDEINKYAQEVAKGV